MPLDHQTTDPRHERPEGVGHPQGITRSKTAAIALARGVFAGKVELCLQLLNEMLKKSFRVLLEIGGNCKLPQKARQTSLASLVAGELTAPTSSQTRRSDHAPNRGATHGPPSPCTPCPDTVSVTYAGARPVRASRAAHCWHESAPVRLAQRGTAHGATGPPLRR
jgi:hypothetical protein